MQSDKLQMIKHSVVSGEIDKKVFNIIDNLHAEDWIEAITEFNSNSDEKNWISNLLPYLIYTYKPELIEEIIEKSSETLIAEALIHGWHTGVNESNEGSTNLQFDHVSSKPIILHILNGHLLKVMEMVDYSEDLIEWVRIRFKEIIFEFVDRCADNNNPVHENIYMNWMIGGHCKPDQYFPPLSDYNEEEVEEALEFTYLLKSIDMAFDILNNGCHFSEESLKLISNMDYEEQLSISNKNLKDVYRKKSELEPIIEYINANAPRFKNKITDSMLYESEMAIVKPIIDGVSTNDIPDNLSAKNTENDSDVFDCIQIEAEETGGSGDIQFSVAEKLKATLLVIKNRMPKIKDKDNASTTMPLEDNEPDPDEEISSLFTEERKKSSGTILISLVVAIIIVVGGLLIVDEQRKNDKQKTVIEKHEVIDKTENKTPYKVIQVN